MLSFPWAMSLVAAGLLIATLLCLVGRHKIARVVAWLALLLAGTAATLAAGMRAPWNSTEQYDALAVSTTTSGDKFDTKEFSMSVSVFEVGLSKPFACVEAGLASWAIVIDRSGSAFKVPRRGSGGECDRSSQETLGPWSAALAATLERERFPKRADALVLADSEIVYSLGQNAATLGKRGLDPLELSEFMPWSENTPYNSDYAKVGHLAVSKVREKPDLVIHHPAMLIATMSVVAIACLIMIVQADIVYVRRVGPTASFRRKR